MREGLRSRDQGAGHLFASAFIFIFLFLLWFEEKKRQIAFYSFLFFINTVVSFPFEI